MNQKAAVEIERRSRRGASAGGRQARRPWHSRSAGAQFHWSSSPLGSSIPRQARPRQGRKQGSLRVVWRLAHLGGLDDQHRGLVGVVVTDAEYAQRPLAGQVDLVALPPVERRTPEGGRVVGVPSVRWSLKSYIRPPFPGPDGRTEPTASRRTASPDRCAAVVRRLVEQRQVVADADHRPGCSREGRRPGQARTASTGGQARVVPERVLGYSRNRADY